MREYLRCLATLMGIGTTVVLFAAWLGARIASGQPVPLPYDEPQSAYTTHYADSAPISNIAAVVCIRTNTIWYGGSSRVVGETNMTVLGTPVTFKIYERRGQISTSEVYKFPRGTNLLEHPIGFSTVLAKTYSYFVMSGRDQIVLTNVTGFPLYPP